MGCSGALLALDRRFFWLVRLLVACSDVAHARFSGLCRISTDVFLGLFVCSLLRSSVLPWSAVAVGDTQSSSSFASPGHITMPTALSIEALSIDDFVGPL